jgi:hypothetical protein
MNEPLSPDAPLDPDDLGPDLLALVCGELEPQRAREIEARLLASPELRAERERLATEWETWTRAQAGSAPQPTRGVLDQVLAAVREEAAERRAAIAGALSPISDEHGADVVALAFGEHEGAERERAQSLLRSDTRLAAAHDEAKRFAGATREALTIEPHPGTLQELMARVARERDAHRDVQEDFDTQDLPQPGPAKRGRLHILRWLAPLAATAAIVALALNPPVRTDTRGAAHIVSGIGELGSVSTHNGGEPVDADAGAFHFDDGDVLAAKGGPMSVRVVCTPDGGEPAATGPLAPGTAEFVLEPGTRLGRVDAAHFDLLEGRVRIEAHDLADLLELRSGDSFARVTGTRFEAAAVDGRLFVIVESGSVALGRLSGPEPRQVTVGAGEQGMVDPRRVVRAALDGRANGDTFLTPIAQLSGPSQAIAAGGSLDFVATLSAGEGGAVGILGFDASEPRFFIRLKGRGEHSLLVKVQESMLSADPPAPLLNEAGKQVRGWQLDNDNPYVLRIRLDGLDLEPGMWEARLRYVSYKASASGSLWLGAVESAPVMLEVRGP